jgi:hypothetical protein
MESRIPAEQGYECVQVDAEGLKGRGWKKGIAVLFKLPKGVIALGLVSLTMDLSSEMIHSLLPLFLVTVLGASALSVGVIEGIAEATAAIAKVFPAC